MEGATFAIGFGVGVVLAKLIDAAWVQPFLERREHRAWLRDRRLEAYVQLSKNLLALSMEEPKSKTPFENFALAANAMLLVEDETLSNDIDRHIAERDKLFRISDGKEQGPAGDETGDALYQELYEQARGIVRRLNSEIHTTPNQKNRWTVPGR